MTAQDALVEYRFLGYRLDARQRKLFKPEGDIVTLSSRAFDALLVLVERHGEGAPLSSRRDDRRRCLTVPANGVREVHPADVLDQSFQRVPMVQVDVREAAVQHRQGLTRLRRARI